VDAQIRSKSAVISVLVHAALLLALIFFVMKTTIPPFPEAGGSGGYLVNIGYIDMATGEVQPLSETITKEPQPEKIKPQAKAQEEKIVTQSLEETIAINEAKRDAKKKEKNNESLTQPVKEAPKVPEKKADPQSLYKGPSTTSKSQGTAASGTGDQGDRSGDPNSTYQGKSGTGTGPGSGDGEGSGSGSGKDGFSFDLSGRSLLRRPTVDDKSQLTGRVVVNITVDKQGTVTSAVPGGRGSTTTNSYLFSKAKEAAMKAKFSPNAEGADIQKGTMTFVFVVQ
jgi:colicin import membrane protein